MFSCSFVRFRIQKALHTVFLFFFFFYFGCCLSKSQEKGIGKAGRKLFHVTPEIRQKFFSVQNDYVNPVLAIRYFLSEWWSAMPWRHSRVHRGMNRNYDNHSILKKDVAILHALNLCTCLCLIYY